MMYFEKSVVRSGLIFLMVAGFLSACPTSLWADEKPPIILDVILDQSAVEEIGGRAMKRHFFKTVEKASDIFYKEVGRRLVVGSVFVENPPLVSKSSKSILLIPTIKWVDKRRGGLGDNRRLIFSATRLIYEDTTAQFFEEFAYGNFIFVRILTNDHQRNVANLLHGFGHSCGAAHSSDPNSLMNPEIFKASSFGDMRDVIKKNCGG